MTWPFSLFGAAEPPQLQSTVLQEREAQSDVISQLALAYEARAEATGDARLGALALLERLRDELKGPAFRGPRRTKTRISERQRKRLIRDIDRIILESKAA